MGTFSLRGGRAMDGQRTPTRWGVLAAACGLVLALLVGRAAAEEIQNIKKALLIDKEGQAFTVEEAWYTTDGDPGTITFVVRNERSAGDLWIAPQIGPRDGSSFIHPSPDSLKQHEKWETTQAIGDYWNKQCKIKRWREGYVIKGFHTDAGGEVHFTIPPDAKSARLCVTVTD
ncbi:MAG: hypothetical protein JOZ63_06550 [Planctomycetaceae bacterium]|nr:hypothetical protein [Planctomycetaceae bacterium]